MVGKTLTYPQLIWLDQTSYKTTQIKPKPTDLATAKINRKQKEKIHGSVVRSDPRQPSPAEREAGTGFKRAWAA